MSAIWDEHWDGFHCLQRDKGIFCLHLVFCVSYQNMEGIFASGECITKLMSNNAIIKHCTILK